MALSQAAQDELQDVDAQEWLGDCKRTREFMLGFGDRLPKEIGEQLDSLQQRLEHTAAQQLREHKTAV